MKDKDQEMRRLVQRLTEHIKQEEGSETDYEEVTEKDKLDEEGLTTNLRTKYKSEMKGSDQLESFLTQVEI